MNTSLRAEKKRAWYLTNHEREKAKGRQARILRKEKHPVNSLLIDIKSRAKISGIKFEIDESDLPVPNVCPYLGTPFIRGTPYVMSVDKIDPSKGYTRGNVEIISRKANLMKSNATKQELITFANSIKEKFG